MAASENEKPKPSNRLDSQGSDESKQSEEPEIDITQVSYNAKIAMKNNTDR